MRTLRQAIILGTLATLGCHSGTGPRAPLIPPLGRYAYSFTHPAESTGVIAAHTFSGTLVLTYATAESIAGRWEVPGYAPQPFGGSHNDALAVCEVSACPTASPPLGTLALDSLDLPYQLGATVVDGTAADSSASAFHFLFWRPDRVVCGASRWGIVSQHIVMVLGTCALQLPTTLGAPTAP